MSKSLDTGLTFVGPDLGPNCLLLRMSKILSGKQFGSRSCPTFVGPDLGPNCLQRF